MRKIVLISILLAICQARLLKAADDPGISVGLAEVDITPPLGYRMAGYFTQRFNTGTHDPLHAKAVVFVQGDTRVALVFCDLIGLPRNVTGKARELAAQKNGIPAANITIAATHSHTGPMYYGELREYFHETAIKEHGKDEAEAIDYQAVLIEKLVEAITNANTALKPARLSIGVVPQLPQLSFNRRFHMKDGSVVCNPGQQNPDIVRAAGPTDPDVGILAIGDGPQPRAILSVFAMHLDTTGKTNYSADYPYHLEKELRKQFGNELISLFGAGACGDLNHIDVSIKAKRSAAEIGAALAGTIYGAFPKLHPLASPSLALRSATVEAPLRKYSAEKVAAAKEKMPKIGTQALAFLQATEIYAIISVQKMQNPLPLEVHAIRLGKDTAIVTLPGEPFVELGLAIKQGSPFKHTLVVELANDDPVYIPMRKAFAEGSYETMNTRVLPGAGEALVETALKLLDELAK